MSKVRSMLDMIIYIYWYFNAKFLTKFKKILKYFDNQNHVWTTWYWFVCSSKRYSVDETWNFRTTGKGRSGILDTNWQLHLKVKDQFSKVKKFAKIPVPTCTWKHFLEWKPPTYWSLFLGHFLWSMVTNSPKQEVKSLVTRIQPVCQHAICIPQKFVCSDVHDSHAVIVWSIFVWPSIGYIVYTQSLSVFINFVNLLTCR